MTDPPIRLLLFMKDFMGAGADVFYWFKNGQIQETDAEEVVSFPDAVLCHDFWMIRDALFDRTGTLPSTIIDIDEFRISTSGDPEERLAREKRDITAWLEKHGADRETCTAYRRMFYKGVPFDEAVARIVAAAVMAAYVDLHANAAANGELDRFFTVEVPVYRLLQLSMTAGISIDTTGLSDKRAHAEYEYFLMLKEYSAKHNMPLETPSVRAVEAKLLKEGFELDEVSVDYVLEFVPDKNDFGGDTIALRDLDIGRGTLASLTLSNDSTRPVVDVFGSRTSRVQVRSPSLQNIPKRYRSIITTHGDARLGYVDFDQFEVGIMAALSGDEELKRLYAEGDLYELFATEHLELSGNRKAAKQLFLSYAYGMSRKALVDAAVSLGVARTRAKTAFKLFERYEEWKVTVWKEFHDTGRVAAICGNHFRRTRSGLLTGKEKRSAVSQVVQGTASLIFKRALLAVAPMEDVRVVLPMHDALLFEHKLAGTPDMVVEAFESIMTEVLDGGVAGKASIGDFVEHRQTLLASENNGAQRP